MLRLPWGGNETSGVNTRNRDKEVQEDVSRQEFAEITGRALDFHRPDLIGDVGQASLDLQGIERI